MELERIFQKAMRVRGGFNTDQEAFPLRRSGTTPPHLLQRTGPALYQRRLKDGSARGVHGCRVHGEFR